MRGKAAKFGLGVTFTIILIGITLLLRILQGEDTNADLVNALLNLYYVPILVAAVLLGETAGVVIALMAILASYIAVMGFWLPGFEDVTFDISQVHSLRDVFTQTGVTLKSLTGVVSAWHAIERQAALQLWGHVVRSLFYLSLASLTARISMRIRDNGREWHSLLEISQVINSSLDLDMTLETIARKSVELTSADACAIRLLNDNATELYFAKTWGLSQPYVTKGPLYINGNTFTQRVLGGEVIQVHDVRKMREMPYYAHMLEEGIISILSLPLKTGKDSIGMLNLYRKRIGGFQQRDQHVAEAFAEQVSTAIHNARLYNSMCANYWETVRSLARAIEAKDPMTLGHSERVATLSQKVGRKLNMASAEVETLEFGAMLHDIGKIGLDEFVLGKADDTLTLDEQMLMEMHPLIGKSILEPVEFLRPTLPIVLYHHERWDGTGYPDGLVGEQIPLMARIVAVVNGYDCVMYQCATSMTELEAVDVMRMYSGTLYDPEMVDALAEVIEEECTRMQEELADHVMSSTMEARPVADFMTPDRAIESQ